MLNIQKKFGEIKMQNWTKTSSQLPPENTVVSTMDSGGNTQDLNNGE